MHCLAALIGISFALVTVTPPSWSAEPVATPGVEIDRIEVSGITVFSQSDIEESLEVSPGDRLERLKVVHTAENLQGLYRMHGYEQVGIKSKLTRRKGEGGVPESVLEFIISEGKPTRIAAVGFTPESIRDNAFEKYWKSIDHELRLKSGLNPGDIFDQEKVTAGKRAIQDLLATEEFIGAKVDDVRVLDGSRPARITSEAGRWISLDFHIDLGDRVAFGFRGNTIFTQGKLSSLVEEQRVLGFGKDYVGAIRNRIEDEYRAEGYSQVKVTPYTVERPARQERHVTYDIEEGPRISLDQVDFDGNEVFSSEELREQFFARGTTLLQHGYYVEKDVQKSADLVVEWIKSKGYLGSKVVTISTVKAEKPKRAGQKPSSVRLIIYVYEGDQTIVHSAEFQGLHAFTAEEVKVMLGLEESKSLNLFAFSEGLERLKAEFRAKGYLSAKIVNEGTDSVIKYSEENRRADVQLEINEGYQFRVSSIVIDGLNLTKEYVVRRELTLKETDVLSETALAESELKLRRLGIFSLVSVRLQDDPDRPDHKSIRISVQEGTPGILAGGPGFRNDLGLRLFGQVAYTNLWGMNHTLSLTANANHRIENFRFAEYSAQLTYLYPWFAFPEMTFRPSFTVSGIQYIKFDAFTANAAVTWEKRLIRNPNVTGVFTYSLERVNQQNAVADEDNQQLLISSLVPALRLDTRDNPLSPSSGWYGTLSYEFAAPWMFSQASSRSFPSSFPIGYSRVQGRLDRLIALPYGVTWYLSYRGGFERSSEPAVPIDPGNPEGPKIPGSGAIPLIKQFALGGASSLRGYAEQALNVQDKSIQGTASYSNYRTQLDLPLVGALRFGPFLDGANLLVDNHSIGQFFFDSLIYGGGLGFHYQTPVGPVNLDLGYKLNPPPNLPSSDLDRTRIYFSIGFI